MSLKWKSASARCGVPVVSLLCLLWTADVGAQTSTPYTLGEVIVSAARPVSEAAAPGRTVTPDDIRAYGARTLDEALALLPGVEVRTGAGGIPRLNVRGFRSRHLVLLLDGIPLNSTFDGQADPFLIPVEQIASIKLAPGTGSVLYGQGGLGGVVNIITRRGGSELAADASGEWRAGDAWLGRGFVSGGGRGVDFFVSGSASESDGYPTVSGSPALGSSAERTRPNSDRQRANLFGSATAQATDRLVLGLVASAVHGAFGLPPNAITDLTDRYANRPVFERVDNVDGVSAHVAATYASAGPVSVRSWAYLNRLDQGRSRFDDSTYSSMDDPRVRGTFRERMHTQLTGAALQMAVLPGSLGRFTLGLSAERDGWDLDLTVRDVPVAASGGGGGKGGGGSSVATYNVRAVADARSLQRYALAVEHEYRPTSRTGVVLGYANHWLEKDSTGRDRTWAASGGVYVDLTARTRFRAALARNIRFPTIRQLYDEDGGNVALRTERSTTSEVGIEKALPGASTVVLTAFRTDVRDYIERLRSGEPFANNDTYRFAGIEATAETTIRSAFLLRGRYTYLDTEDRSPGSARDQLQYRPRHRASIEGRCIFPFGLSASVSVLRVLDQVYYSRQEPITIGRLPDYTLANVRLQRSLPRSTASIYVGVDNLFDERYEEEYGSPQATRVIYTGLTLRRR